MPAFPRCLTALSLGSSCLLGSCFGGQSGDDGDFVDDVGGFPVPQPPGPTTPEVCEGTTPRPLEPDEVTTFEVTAHELLAALAQPQAPFHWVEYSSTNLSATHAPGPGVSALALGFALRSGSDLDAGEELSETVVKSDEDTGPCPKQFVQIPIWLDLDTADGALDAHVKGTLVFYSPLVATLHARFDAQALGGSFELAAPVPTNSDYTWSVSSYTLSATVWRGGSRGMLSPEFSAKSKVAIGGGGTAVSPPPATPPMPGDTPTISVPDAWEAVGVWPRLEQCGPGIVVDVDDRVVGASARDIIDALVARNEFALTVRSNATSSAFEALDIRVTPTTPLGLVCVNATPQAGTLELIVDAHLASNDSNGASLDADLRLSVEGHVDQTARENVLTRVRFERVVGDAARPVERAAFEASTGVSLAGAPDEYTHVWWTWFGEVSASMESSHEAARFVVTSPNSHEAAAIAEQVAEGGPGFEIGYDEDGQQLPGDRLLEATSTDDP